MANRVVHFEVPTKDIKRASDFYAKAFGWEMQPQGEDFGGYVVAVSGPAMPDSDPKNLGINGGLYQTDKHDTENINAFRCVIGVDDVDKAIKDVRTAGGIVSEHNLNGEGKDMGEKMEIPGIGTWAKCQDTEGNFFSLLQPSPDMTSKP